MSTTIENIARNAYTGLTGGDRVDRSTAQNVRGKELIKQLATGGLALGAGAGSAVALINYLKSLRDESELLDESRLNDDTLYINAPKKEEKEKSAADEGEGGVNRWLAPGLALTGGILTTGGAYALTQAVYNYLQKKRRQSMLDEAQQEVLTAADLETQKSAAEGGGVKMNFYDLATAFPVAVPLLAALASGGVAYAALNKTFPTVKSPKSKFPKRIRQVSQKGAVSDYEDEKDALKSASARQLRAEQDCENAAFEFLLTITDQMSIEKSASHKLTSDIINNVAKNGIESALSTYQDAGLEGLVEISKGASDEPVDMPNKMLATAVLCKSARLSPIIAAVASAEFQEMAPNVYEMAVSQGEEHMDKMAGVASLMHLSFFRPQILEKGAATNPLMETLLAGYPEGVDVEEMEDILTTDATGALAAEAEGEGAEFTQDLEDGDMNESPDDPVDAMLSGVEDEPVAAMGAMEEDEEYDRTESAPV